MSVGQLGAARSTPRKGPADRQDRRLAPQRGQQEETGSRSDRSRDASAADGALGNKTDGLQLLCAVSRRLRELVRDNDLVSRTGGDEFSIVQSGTELPMAAAAALAARVVEALSVLG